MPLSWYQRQSGRRYRWVGEVGGGNRSFSGYISFLSKVCESGPRVSPGLVGDVRGEEHDAHPREGKGNLPAKWGGPLLQARTPV